jgi:exodeoxyribonuclease VII small subunit
LGYVNYVFKLFFTHGIIATHEFGALSMTRKPKLPDLETSLAEINTLIEKMEKGELTLEQSLDCFERGITLIKNSQKILQEAEQKVQILLNNQTLQADELQDYENKQE